ncbi:hypothetical protein HDV00_011879 [Rhizophlyctis rosea]|nr:hypothetical protein HDV00_011879 [Rhizophlyctis rosea]
MPNTNETKLLATSKDGTPSRKSSRVDLSRAGSTNFGSLTKLKTESRRSSRPGSGASGGLAKALAEVANENTYYYNGHILGDKGNQTDHDEWASFDETAQMCSAMRKDLELTRLMLQVNEHAALQKAGSEIYQLIMERIADLEQEHKQQIRFIRRECQQQLRQAAEAIKEEHKQYNAYMIVQVDENREKELQHAEERVERAETQLENREKEVQKLKFNAARLYMLLKKHNLLTGDENLSTEEERAKTADIIDQYQAMLDHHDNTILWLRGRIGQLEELTDARQQGTTRPTTTATIVQSSRASLATLGVPRPSAHGSNVTIGHRRSIAGALLGTTGTLPNEADDKIWGVSLEEETEDEEEESKEEEIDEDLVKANALEQSFEAQISELTLAQTKELDSLQAERDRLAKEWEIKLTSLLRLHDEDIMQKVARRQERLLKLAVQTYRPRRGKEVGLQAYTGGITLEMIRQEEQRIRDEKLRLEQVERDRLMRLQELEDEQNGDMNAFRVQGRSMRFSHGVSGQCIG